MKNTNKILTVAQRCKNILASNFRGQLHTIKADAKGSKDEIHSSPVKYFFKKGKPYIWVPGDDLHNVNAIIDERGAFSVTNALPGPLTSLLKSLKKLPARVAVSGDIVHLKDDKVRLITESLRESIISERNAAKQFTYPVTGILSSSTLCFNSRSENLLEIIDGCSTHTVYKFNISSLAYVDGDGGSHEVESADIEACKTDPLAPFAEKLLDGINQNRARRRALMLFCFAFLNINARDAFMLSVDCKGFDILGKVPGEMTKDGFGQYEWKEFRFDFQEAASDIESFCRLLVDLEEEALKTVSSFSGLGL